MICVSLMMYKSAAALKIFHLRIQTAKNALYRLSKLHKSQVCVLAKLSQSLLGHVRGSSIDAHTPTGAQYIHHMHSYTLVHSILGT